MTPCPESSSPRPSPAVPVPPSAKGQQLPQPLHSRSQERTRRDPRAQTPAAHGTLEAATVSPQPCFGAVSPQPSCAQPEHSAAAWRPQSAGKTPSAAAPPAPAAPQPVTAQRGPPSATHACLRAISRCMGVAILTPGPEVRLSRGAAGVVAAAGRAGICGSVGTVRPPERQSSTVIERESSTVIERECPLE